MKYVLNIYFFLLFFLLTYSSPLMSQNSQISDSTSVSNTEDISISFIKDHISQSPDSLYFNVIKIDNNKSTPIDGKLNITLPSGFHLISPNNTKLNIDANQSYYYPIRASIPTEAEGDKSYLIVADFKSNDKIYSKNNYIEIPGQRQWKMFIEQKSFYVSEYNQIANLSIHLQNRGNTTEMVKLEFKVGHFLDVLDLDENQDYLYFELPPHVDTLIKYPIRYIGNHDHNSDYKNIWKESAITIKASNQIYQRTDHIYVNEMESQFENYKDQRETPLNLELQLNNLLSGSPARYNASVFGTVLFPNTKEVSYQFTGRNFLFSPYSEQNLSLEQNGYYDVRYRDKTKFVELGSQIGNYSLHNIYGRGLKAEINPNSKNKFNFAIIQGRFRPDYAGSVMYSRKFQKSLSTNIGLTYEDNNSTNYDAYSLQFGGGFSFLKHHSLGLQLLLTQTTFNDLYNNSLAPQDTSNFGLSYQVYYALRFHNFNFRISNTNSLNNYITNSNNNRWNAYGNYKISKKINANLIYDRSKILSTRYPERFTKNSNYNINDVGRLIFGYAASHKVYYMLGPIYNGIYQRIYNSTNNYLSDYKNAYYALNFSTRFRLSKNRSITPNINIGLSNASYTNTDPSLPQSIEKNNVKSIRVGINYYSKIIRLNAYYNNGLVAVSQQQLLFDGDWINSESIQIRPQIEKFFSNNTIRISSYINYIYRMPSGRESINFNLSLSFYLKHGWTFYGSSNIYTTSRNDAEIGRITNRNFSVFIGIKKSFDIAQPRIKYYDYDFVFFHDEDGNKQLDENERVIPNMMMKLQRNRDVKQQKSNFVEMNLVSNAEGRISYKNLPEGEYKTSLESLNNLEDLYILNGKDQNISVNEDKTYFIPLTESYKVIGQIKVKRDPNSNEGKIDLSNIRITAQSKQGQTYSVLSDSKGGFILSIPQAGHYKVSINEVLGENFSLEKSEYTVDFNGIKRIVIDFVFVEKERGINFNNGGYQFKSLNGNNNSTE